MPDELEADLKLVSCTMANAPTGTAVARCVSNG
jgi:hypothetical protein